MPSLVRARGNSRSESSTTAMPIGTLTRKIQCQSSESVSTPPSSTPIEPPPDATNPKTPIAFARSAGSVNRFIISESETAEATAPPTPCTARAAISTPCDSASPQQIEAIVNSAMPPMNSVRWPYRSPRRPPRSRNPPNVSRYAFTTHASEVDEKPRSSLMEGSATFTIVVSSTIMSVPRQRTIRAYQRVRSVSSVIERFLSACSLNVDGAERGNSSPSRR